MRGYKEYGPLSPHGEALLLKDITSDGRGAHQTLR